MTILDILPELEDKSVSFKEGLRFSINSLEIFDKSTDRWKNFEDLQGRFFSPRGRKSQLGLNDLLLDTGNEAGYCLLPIHYFYDFTNNLMSPTTVGNFSSKILSNVEGLKLSSSVSEERYDFRLFEKVYFKSKVGFKKSIDKNYRDLHTIIIDMNTIRQFLNVIFLYQNKYWYYCRNF